MQMFDEKDENIVDDRVSSLEDDTVTSEQKMMKLMEEMQKTAMSIPDDEPLPNMSPKVPLKDVTGGVTINTNTDDANYWEIDNLPTKGLLYGDVKIMARPLKVMEVKKLTSLNDDNAESVINDVLRRTVRGIDINELYSADKMYILLWLRANSFRDNRYVVDYVCDKCGKDAEYHFDINMVGVDYIDDDNNGERILTLSNGDVLVTKMLQIKDEISLSNFSTKFGKLFETDEDGIDDELLMISYMIKSINSEDVDAVSKYNYVLGMTAEDFSTLTTALGDNVVGIKPYIDVECDKCGGTSQLGITFQPDFFLPKYKS